MSDNPKELFLSGLRKDEDIIEAISKCLGCDRTTIEKHTRCQKIVKARDLVAYLLREYGNFSYSKIGRLLGGRDHTTILHAYRKIKKNIQKPTKKSDIMHIGKMSLFFKLNDRA